MKAHHRDPPEPITCENIFSAFAFYMPGEEIEACLCYGEAVAKDTRVSQTSSIPSYFKHLSLFVRFEEPLLLLKPIVERKIKNLFHYILSGEGETHVSYSRCNHVSRFIFFFL